MEEIIIKASDGYALNAHIFDVPSPKAIVCVVHGMEEYQDRYHNFAEELNKADYAVLTADMRGHGPKAKNLGFFSKKNGHIRIIEDQRDITKFIKNKWPDVPIYLLGHSMGAIIIRHMLMNDSKDYQKVVLSGFPNYQGAASIGAALCKIIHLFKGPKAKSAFLKSLALGPYTKAIKDRHTDLDWLSYNPENVNKYINDPLCGYGFTVSAYHDLFVLVKQLNNPKAYVNVNTNLEMILVSGKDDPVTGGEKGRNHSIKILEKAGFQVKKNIIYPNMRHEVLNEKDNQLVVNDIIDFYNHRL